MAKWLRAWSSASRSVRGKLSLEFRATKTIAATSIAIGSFPDEGLRSHSRESESAGEFS
jgi:hypothetical protein